MNPEEYRRAGVYAEGDARGVEEMSEEELQKKISGLLLKGDGMFGVVAGKEYMTR